MSKVKGKVTGVGKGKYSYFITLEEKEGFYFNTKFEPKCGKDDIVGIEYEQKADNRGNVKRVEVIESNSNGYEPDAYKGENASTSVKAGATRQDSIVWQSSRKDALVMVGILLGAEGFAVKGKPDAKRVQLEALVDEITYGYFEAASDPRRAAAFTTNADVTEDAPPPEAEEAPVPAAETKGAWDDSWD
jgi:hypothetical protein